MPFLMLLNIFLAVNNFLVKMHMWNVLIIILKNTYRFSERQ